MNTPNDPPTGPPRVPNAPVAEHSAQASEPERRAPVRPSRRRRAARASLWSFAVLSVLAGVLSATIYAAIGRPIAVPGWMQDRIEARIARELPQARVTFAEIVLVVEQGWRPRVRLRDVRVKTPDGAAILTLNEFKAGFAMAPLLDGIVQPRDVSITGVVATLERDSEGRVTLSGGLGRAPFTRSAATLPQLIGQLDAVLQRPALENLREAELRALTLRFDDQRSQRSWTLDGGRLLLSRRDQRLDLTADLALLSGGDGVATLSANYSSVIGRTASKFGVSLSGMAAQDLAVQGPAFAWLDVLRAPISGAVRGGLDAQGQVTPINATLQIGAGAVQPNDSTRPIPFSGARSYFNYDPQARRLRFDDVSVRSDWGNGDASGTAVLGLAEDGTLDELVGQFALRDLKANPDGLYDAPVSLAGVDVDFRLSLDPFEVELGRVQVSDQGKSLRLSGELAARPEGWQVALDGRMDGLAPKRLVALWPPRVAAKTRKWIDENIIRGDVSNIDLALRLGPGATRRTYVAFDYANAEVRYSKTLPHVTDGAGHFSLSDTRLVVGVDRGRLLPDEGGALRIGGSSFIMPDISIRKDPPAVVRLAARGPVTAALSLLDRPPLRAMQKAGLPVALAEGEADVAATLSLPLTKNRKPGALKFHVDGTLRDVRSDVLIKGRSLRAPELALKVDNDGLSLSGQGTLDGVGFDGAFRQPIGPGAGPGQVTADVTLNKGALETFGVGLPAGTLRGQTTAALEATVQRGAAPTFSLMSQLRGLRLSVPQVGWAKPAEAAATLEVAGRLGQTPQIDTLRLDGAGLSAVGRIDLRPGGTLERLRFDRVQVGGWLDAPVDLIGQGPGQPVQVALRGGRLDLRRAEFGAGGSSGGPGNAAAAPPIQLRLDSLQITDTIALTGMTGSFVSKGGLDGSFEARLNGGAPVRGRVVPRNGRTAVRIMADDAGAVLRSAGLLRQVVGGTMDLTLIPVGSGGAFDGSLDASDVRIRNAPGIAGLVNAISVVGLINELNGDGIYFDDVEARFRLTPDRLTLTRASATGASLGLSMDGVYGLGNNMIDMQGVISPVYLLNGIGSLLTRKGEGLIGFNYTLRGPAKSPKVGVNPLSALTPGMFRDIFRRPPPKLPDAEPAPAQAPDTAADPAPSQPRAPTQAAPQATTPGPSRGATPVENADDNPVVRKHPGR